MSNIGRCLRRRLLRPIADETPDEPTMTSDPEAPGQPLRVETQLQAALGFMLGGSLLAGAALALSGWLSIPAAVALIAALWLLLRARSGLDSLAASARRVAALEASFGTLASAVAELQAGSEQCRRGFGQSTVGTAGASLRIADAIGAMDRIAFQTHLMALNTAVQATRAAKAGQAYADVARELIKHSRDASALAREAATALRDCRRLVDEGSNAAMQSEIRLDGLLEKVNALRYALARLGIEVPVTELPLHTIDIADPEVPAAARQGTDDAYRIESIDTEHAASPTPAAPVKPAYGPGAPGFVERRSPDSPGARLRGAPPESVAE